MDHNLKIVELSQLATANKDSTVSRIPHEILALILIYAKSGLRDGLGLKPQKRISFDLAISQVCTFWRDVAIDTPALWATIIVFPSPHSELIRIYLSRSKMCL
jgi:hypothetical protein